MRSTRAISPLVPRPESRRVGFMAWSVVLLLLLAVSSAEAQFNSGDVLAGVGSGKIKRFNPAGVLQQTLDSTTGSSETTGMCFDGSGNLFATMFTVSQVSKFTNTGALVASTFGTGYNADPESCVFQGANILVGQADGLRKVRKLDPTGALITEYTVATGPRGTDWIDLAADQCTLHYTSEGSAIKTFNVCTNTQGADFATGLTGGACYAHRIRPNGEELVACSSVALRVSSTGAILQTYPGSGFTPASSFLFALNLDPDGTTFWTGDLANGNVYRINIASGAQVTSFNAGILGSSMAGLAVVGEIVVSQPSPTPTGTVIPATATPTNTPVGPAAVVPTLSFPMLGLLCAALMAVALLLMRR